MGRRIADPVRRKIVELMSEGWQAPEVIAYFARGNPDFPWLGPLSISERTIRRIVKENYPSGITAARRAKNRKDTVG